MQKIVSIYLLRLPSRFTNKNEKINKFMYNMDLLYIRVTFRCLLDPRDSYSSTTVQ